MRYRIGLYLVVLLLTLAWLSTALRSGPAPSGRRPLPVPVPLDVPQRPLPAAAPDDPEVTVALGPKHSSTGSAFALRSDGVWLTARHVVDQCGRVALMFPGRTGQRVRRIAMHPNADLAVLFTRSAPPALTLRAGELRIGQNGYHIGYPQGRPGQVWSTLLGRRRMRIRGRYRTNEPVVAWVERRRDPTRLAELSGLSGGPALSDQGEVLGVLVASSGRRGRVFTTAPRSVRQLVGTLRGGLARRTPSRPRLTPATLRTAADRLRHDHRVVRVVCLVDSGRG